MNPDWSRQVADVMNSAAMRGQPMDFRAAFVRATAKVESAKELPDHWKLFVRQALASGAV